MKGSCDGADGRALDAEHLREKLVGQGQFVRGPAVARSEDPAAAARLDAVRRVACDALKGLRQQSLREAQDELLDSGARGECFVHPVERDAGRRSGDLHDIPPEGIPGDEGADETEQGLASERSHLGRFSVQHDGHERHHRVVGEIGMLDRVAGLVDDLASLELDEVQLRLHPGEILLAQGGQKPVGTVRAVHPNLCHNWKACSEQSALSLNRPSWSEFGSGRDARWQPEA